MTLHYVSSMGFVNNVWMESTGKTRPRSGLEFLRMIVRRYPLAWVIA
jgi:hypothetical protein